MNIAIVRAFISLKQVAIQHKDLAERLEELRKELHERIGEHDTQLAAIYEAIENLLDEKTETKTGKKENGSAIVDHGWLNLKLKFNLSLVYSSICTSKRKYIKLKHLKQPPKKGYSTKYHYPIG